MEPKVIEGMEAMFQRSCESFRQGGMPLNLSIRWGR